MTVLFDGRTHTYTDDGVCVPSVTQIITAVVFPNAYKDVPESVLKAKAEYGNRIHQWVEEYALKGVKKRQSALMKLTTNQVVKIFERERIIIHSTEQIISAGRYAGTYDMYGTWRGEETLFDIKTTQVLNIKYLEWQLGMYKEAMKKPVKKCAVLWCPKGDLVQLIEVQPKKAEEIDWLVDRYEQEFITG